MTNKDILEIAMKQSAIDANCKIDDFKASGSVIVESIKNSNARRYLESPIACNLISYGQNIVASIQMEYKDIVENYIRKYQVEHCFETPNMHVLNNEFEKYGMQVCFMAEYFLPDINELSVQKCKYELRVLEQQDFVDLYLPQWGNALSHSRKELDVLGVGAYKDNKLVGLAGCSADSETMWQIGVDVLPEVRRQGIATALTGKLAIEILAKGKVPFYCCAWSNIKSVRNAIKSGFRPAWVEMTIKSKKFVDSMNE
ncbi:MAG: GNAT family N-acetyltransferase [Clostridium sp.]|uniref:GNAT family N-acetyltransferase n=1 Tax=Clostridium sp. TaxID=1506 RepID=UPI003F40DD4A